MSQQRTGLGAENSATESEHRMQVDMTELVERISRVVAEDGSVEPLDGLRLSRLSAPREPFHGVYKPALCVIAQGSKVVLLGESRFQYDPAHYLLAMADLPIVAQVIGASPEKPYLSLRLDLDLITVSSVMIEAGQVPPRSNSPQMGIDVSTLDAGLLDAVVRLVRLVDEPEEARFLSPLIRREITYRLLTGDQGDRLRDIVVRGGHAYRISEAIRRISEKIAEPLRVETMANDLGMSPSSFYQHFRAITAMSPLQYQKRLRLQEARRLLVGEHLNAADAAYRVGYDDASHFSREYKRLFGLPPMRDAQRLRDIAHEGTTG